MTDSFMRFAGWTTYANAGLTIANIVTIMVFFAAGGFWGRLNDSVSVLWALSFLQRRFNMESTNTIRNAGLVTVIGALIGVGVSITRATEMSLPVSGAVSLEEILTVIAFVTLFFGAAGLARSGAAGDGSVGKIGFGAVFVGLILATFYELALIFQSEPSEVPGILSGLLVGVGMLIVGIAVLQSQRWHSWRRFTPLLIGLYPLLMVFTYPLLESSPALSGGAGQALDQGLTAIWFFFWLPLGMALWVEAGRELTDQPELAR